MAISKKYSSRGTDRGYFGKAFTNASKIIGNLTRKMSQLKEYGDLVVHEVVDIFVKEARQRLILSGYEGVKEYAKNIIYTHVAEGKYKIGFKDNSQKKIMYFLEFGTGVVGEDNPHPDAAKVGWEYNVGVYIEDYLPDDNGFPTGYNSLGEFVGYRGWFYKDPKSGQLKFTSGLHAIRYIYDTMQKDNMNRIIEQAKQNVRRSFKWLS